MSRSVERLCIETTRPAKLTEQVFWKSWSRRGWSRSWMVRSRSRSVWSRSQSRTVRLRLHQWILALTFSVGRAMPVIHISLTAFVLLTSFSAAAGTTAGSGSFTSLLVSLGSSMIGSGIDSGSNLAGAVAASSSSRDTSVPPPVCVCQSTNGNWYNRIGL